MTTSTVLSADLQSSRMLRVAVAAYLARFKATSRTHAESDLRANLRWCAERRLDPLAASRPQVELGEEHGHMLNARGIPPDTTWWLLEVLQPALIDIPRAERFTALSRRRRSV